MLLTIFFIFNILCFINSQLIAIFVQAQVSNCMKKTFFILVFLHLFIQAYPIYFKHIGRQEGLSQLSVLAIYQDALGRMWFGTEEGVNIYDGVKTIAYKPSDYHTSGNFIIGNKIQHITGDQKGNVYLNSDNSLVVYDIHSQQFSHLKKGNIHAIYIHKETLWFGVSDSICTIDSNTGKQQLIATLPHAVQYATDILIDSKESCWVGTYTGLYCKKKNSPLVCVIPDIEVYQIMEDSHHNMWISTWNNGLYRYSPDGKITNFTHIPGRENQIASTQVRGLAEDHDGCIWIGTFQGLDKYNPANNSFISFTSSNRPGSISHNSVFPLFKDKQGSIWVGTYYGGINYFNSKTDLFTFYSADITKDDCLSYPFVGRMVEDKDSNIWICTEGGGLNFFDRKTKKFEHYLMDSPKNSIAHNNLKSIVYDSARDKLYIGTHTKGISIYNIRTRQFDNSYMAKPELAYRIGDRISQLKLWNDTLVFTTQKGIWKMDVETNEILPFFSNKTFYGNTSFLKDRKGYIWVASKTGVYRINLKNEQDQYYYAYNKQGLGNFNVTQMIEDPKGRIFLGTNGSGLYYFDEKNNQFIGYTTDNSGIAGNYCYELALFTQGELIISGDKGLSFFDPDLKSFKIVELGAALPLTGINAGCGILVCRDGEIFVGGTNGLTSFFEQQLLVPQKEYQLYFSDLFINNEIVRPNDYHNVLTNAMPYTHDIELKHNQNDLIIKFATNNYINPLQKPAYEYILEGFDERWIKTFDHQTMYTNITPGSYILKIREVKQNAKHQPQIISMNIKVLPPFYATPLFYFIYFIIIIGILYSIFRFKQSKLLLKTSLEIEKKEKEKISEINQAKLQFFANISHEFRTPLTLILSQIDLLLQSHSLAPIVYNKLLRINRNAQHMRGLISELLDFRKLEQGHVQLKVYEQNIVPFLKEIYLSFYEYANTRSMNYTFNSQQEEIKCWFDPSQMQKVVYNLLSNAFKYTPYNSCIELHIEEKENQVIFKVIDNGIGIRREHLDNIFNCFFQADKKDSNIENAPSTGIGLALTKGLVELHHGTIRVESTPGYGTIFIVSLQKGDSHFTEAEHAQAQLNTYTLPSTIVADSQSEFYEVDQEESEGEEANQKILIVEDNEELLEILSSIFISTYKVILARNGKEGLEKVRETMPDIVVSDVMMPEMSGIEMCMKIKNDLNICHIPVVLLTALSSVEQNIEGLRIGADDYISKPFNIQILVSRCNNLLRNRIMLKNKLNKQENFDTQLLANNPVDQKLLKQINAIIDENLENPEFNVTILAKELNLSRSSLYNKFQALTGMTPNEFVLNYKLKRAAAMLRNNPELQIADITYKLGFHTPRYFSQCFKAQYGIIPTDYRKREGKS